MQFVRDGKFGLVVGLAAAVISGHNQSGFTQINKGSLILIDRGLQVQGMVTKDDVFHLSTYSNANYTSIHWLWDSNPSLMGAVPGFPWSRWAGDEKPGTAPISDG